MLTKEEIHKHYDKLLFEKRDLINTKYRTINGYLSASKLIRDMQNKDFLTSWKNRVGEQEALRITRLAAERGTLMHNLIESRLTSNAFIYQGDDTPGVSHFLKMIPYLDKIDPVLMESTLFSDKLKITGRCDCIGYYNDILSIIDFKTSRKPKKLEWMKSYTIQVTLYAIMFYDMFGIKLTQSVLLNSPDDEDELLINPCQEFVFDTNNYLKDTLEFLQRHRNGERECLKI